MNLHQQFLFIMSLVFLLVGCGKASEKTSATNDQKAAGQLVLKQVTLSAKADTQRWYFAEQVNRGKTVFANNCAVCHGQNAEATADWKTRDSNGYYPPPPLNGSAHAWHHPLSVLVSSIKEGGAALGGQMPGFKSQLTESEILDAIAYFQAYWSEEIYLRWLDIEKSSRE